MEYSTQPWEKWPREETPEWDRGYPFKSGYQDTLNRLDKELTALNAKEVVVQVNVKRADIRLDGQLRSDAKVLHPGVILSFKREGRDISMPCDACKDWKDNLRAIALTLERLRLADLYGVTQSDEQYRGWEALPPPGAQAQGMTREEALDVLAKWSGISQAAIDTNPRLRPAAIREAKFNAHPDKGGSAEASVAVEQAAKILEGT